MKDYEKIVQDMVSWLRDKRDKTGLKGAVFGLSGGVDSAVVAGLSKLAFGDDHLAIVMPIHSLEEDEVDAKLVADKLGIKTARVDLTSTYDDFVKSAKADDFSKMSLSNIKPRLRMTNLYLYGQNLSYMVLGSSNKSEYLVGYFTKWADSACDIYLLRDFYKREVYEIAKVLGVPDEVINKKPSAGLWKGQSDEDELGVSYDDIEKYFEGEAIAKEKEERIKKLYNSTEHKRSDIDYFKNIY